MIITRKPLFEERNKGNWTTFLDIFQIVVYLVGKFRIMKVDLPIEVKRFKQIREEQNLTQAEFAEVLGIKNSTADIERGKTRLLGSVVAQLLHHFQINPLWLYGESFQKELSLFNQSTMPKVISVDKTDQENMLLVSQKAAAGYPQNLDNGQWYERLPAFDLPLPQFRNATYRGFQIEGDSMLPDLRPGDWVLAKAVEHLADANPHKIYVFVLQDAVLVKKLHKTKSPNTIVLLSSNSTYPPYEIPVSSIQEIWEVKSKLTFTLNENAENTVLKKLEASMEDLKEQLASFKQSS